MSDFDTAVETEEELTSYSSSTPAAATNRPAIKAPGGGTGRRKEAVARVRLRPGTGTITINSRAFDNYFTSATHRQMVMEPLRLTDQQQTYDIDVTIEGGGTAGQAGALRLGIARSLLELDEATRPALKKAGLLTRDSRKKESKKYGLKKARKAPQYSKR